MIKKIQAGNTIHIRWTITKNRNTSLDNLSVKLFDVFRKDCAINYEIEELDDKTILIKIVYEGKEQKTFGKYSLVLFNNYGEDNQNTLIFKDCFILLHALNNKLESWNDEYADNAILVEIDSDLSVALINQEIQDKDDIIEQISELSDTISDMQDQIDNISISDDVIEELENRFDSSFIALNSSIDVLNTSIDSLIESLDVSFNNIVDEIEKSERVLVEYFSIIDNSVNMLMNSSTQDFDDTELRTMISNTDTSIIDVSTRLKDLSTYTHNLVIPEEYDDSELRDLITSSNSSIFLLKNSVSSIRDQIIGVNGNYITLQTKINDLSTYTHNLVISDGYDDTVIKNRIADVSQYVINTSSKLSDLSTYVHNIVIPDSYDDTLVNSSILDISIRLNDLSTYTHNLTPGSGDVDLTDVNSSISDLSTRIKDIENNPNISDWQDSFYYTSLDTIKTMVSGGKNILNTSYLDFRSFIMCTSSGFVYTNGICIADNAWPSNKNIDIKDVFDNSTGWITRYTVSGGMQQRYAKIKIGTYEDNSNRAKSMTDFFFLDTSIVRIEGVNGKWVAYHFPNKMRITNYDASINGKYIYFKLEN